MTHVEAAWVHPFYARSGQSHFGGIDYRKRCRYQDWMDQRGCGYRACARNWCGGCTDGGIKNRGGAYVLCMNPLLALDARADIIMVCAPLTSRDRTSAKNHVYSLERRRECQRNLPASGSSPAPTSHATVRADDLPETSRTRLRSCPDS